VLTPRKVVPRSWFPESLQEVDVLCLAGSGGQQAPILAAAGATVTVLDNSPQQLAQDRLVAEREGLELKTVEGDMRDLGAFSKSSFDLIVHPVSNCFVDNIRPVWREAFRVLRRGGALLSGFVQPVAFAIDLVAEKRGTLEIKHTIPYSDITSPSEEEHKLLRERDEPLCFGHTLEDQIGGQLEAGFLIAGYYDDLAAEGELLARYMATFGATRAMKL
jgi:SAM-dependent methyltransferase